MFVLLFKYSLCLLKHSLALHVTTYIRNLLRKVMGSKLVTTSQLFRKILNTISLIPQHHLFYITGICPPISVCQSLEMGAYYIFVYVMLFVLVRGIPPECPPWFNQVSETSPEFPECVCSSAVKSIIDCNQRERTSYVKVGHCAY